MSSRKRRTSQETGRARWQRHFRDVAGCRTSTRLVLWELAAHADSDGAGAAPGVARLSAAAGVSPATVKRALDWGRETGWVVRTGRGARRLAEPDTYALAVPEVSQPVPPAVIVPPAPEPEPDTRPPAGIGDIAAMSASQFKTSVLMPSYGVVSETEMDALRETYWSKLGAES